MVIIIFYQQCHQLGLIKFLYSNTVGNNKTNDMAIKWVNPKQIGKESI